MMKNSSLRISVIICTRNRVQLLDKCLMSIKEQTLDAQDFEVLVVDNGSSDATPILLEKYRDHLPLVTIAEPIVGLSRARNTGWRAAKTDFIAFLDDDAMADPDWLAAGLQSFEKVRPTPAALTGPIRLVWEQPPPQWLTPNIQGCLGYLDFGPVARQFGGVETLFGANCFFHREMLEKFSGFNEKLGRLNTILLSGEETLLQRQIENAGKFLWYDPRVSVRHWVPAARTTRKWFYQRYYWGGISDLFMNKILGPIPGSPATQRQRGSTLRVAQNLFHSCGLGSQTRVVQARIYMSYVCGWFSGELKWRRLRDKEKYTRLHENGNC